MSLHPEIDESACAAHGDCEALAPHVFQVGDVAEVTGSGPDDLIVSAARACPAMAIRVIDDATGKQVYP